MPVALHSFLIENDKTIGVCHTFYGRTRHQAEARQSAHAADCPHYGPALKAGRTIDILEEIDELPEDYALNEEGLTEFLELEDEEEEDDEEEEG